MHTTSNTLIETPANEPGSAGSSGDSAGIGVSGQTACFHCGEPCPDSRFAQAEKTFCCHGCQTVHDLLTQSGLGHFYDLNQHPGVRMQRAAKQAQWAFLDEPQLQQQLIDFTDGKTSRVTFHVPAIHCIACVWLLENLFRLHPGIGRAQVNFPRREVAITFSPAKITLSELVALLASIGYEPALTLGELDKPKVSSARKRQWLQVGIAGFAFGNIMLFSMPMYLGMDSLSAPLFRVLFGYLSLALAVPVLVYSASDFWKNAALSLRQRTLTLDVPIALGLAAIYIQSAYEIVSGHGEGYLDSLSGLVFFLLCGRVFQQMTHERMSFERDYKCFFPLSVVRKTAAGEESVSLSNLRIGNRLLLRNGELIPADSKLIQGPALIDYSFVTGESEAVNKEPGDYLYAGGAQIGGSIEVETVKPVSQSYLTSLWNHEAFQKDRDDNLNTLTNRYSRRFTVIVVGVAVSAAVGWILAGDLPRGVKAFISVLIVACPCALALAAPFTLGTAQRLLARISVFLKNALVIERLARVNAIVFDKTGTLTTSASGVEFCGLPLTLAFSPSDGEKEMPTSRAPRPAPLSQNRSAVPHEVDTGALFESRSAVLPLPLRGGEGRGEGASSFSSVLTPEETRAVFSLARHSTHPLSMRIAGSFAQEFSPLPVHSFSETPGCGIKGTVHGRELCLGSPAWLRECGIEVPDATSAAGSVVALAINGHHRGTFMLSNALRPETDRLLSELSARYEIALLSGDNEKEREHFRSLFGDDAHLHFNQSPLDKLGFIRRLQAGGKTVMMVGDGLNDAGALKQSNVGVAVVEKVGAFSPASDVIIEAKQVPQLFEILALARKSASLVRWGFVISALYNVVGVSIAAAGILSPLICAILMPISSITVVLFACGTVNLAAKRVGLLSPGASPLSIN